MSEEEVSNLDGKTVYLVPYVDDPMSKRLGQTKYNLWVRQEVESLPVVEGYVYEAVLKKRKVSRQEKLVEVSREVTVLELSLIHI